jgi:hypothetical protein
LDLLKIGEDLARKVLAKLLATEHIATKHLANGKGAAPFGWARELADIPF